MKDNNFSRSNIEEIFMYLSIFVALMAYHLELRILMWVFIVKACIEGLAAIVLAVKEIRKEKKLKN